jgi:hypothetical protein
MQECKFAMPLNYLKNGLVTSQAGFMFRRKPGLLFYNNILRQRLEANPALLNYRNGDGACLAGVYIAHVPDLPAWVPATTSQGSPSFSLWEAWDFMV